MNDAEWVGIVVAALALWGRMENRMGRIEAILKSLPCSRCAPKPIKPKPVGVPDGVKFFTE